MSTPLCTLKNGDVIYKGDTPRNRYSPAASINMENAGDVYLVLENGTHFLISSDDANISDSYLINLACGGGSVRRGTTHK